MHARVDSVDMANSDGGNLHQGCYTSCGFSVKESVFVDPLIDTSTRSKEAKAPRAVPIVEKKICSCGISMTGTEEQSSVYLLLSRRTMECSLGEVKESVEITKACR